MPVLLRDATRNIVFWTALIIGVQAQVSWANKGDAIRGQRAWKVECRSCHTIDQNYLGPKHRGLIGRRVGKLKGYNFSPALARSNLVWDEALLDRWIADPEQVVRGQWMGYRVDSAQTRADLIAYLATLK
jgi:cytochrome c